jgi:PAS domain S-box-containing protein
MSGPELHPEKPLVPRLPFIRRLLAVTLVANLLFLGLVGYLLHQSRLSYEERAVSTTQNLSRVFAGQIEADVDKIDLTVLKVVDEVEKQLATGGINERKINAFIALHQARLPVLDGLRVVNAQGEQIYGTDVGKQQITNIRDRAYFERLSVDTNAGLVISEPMVGRLRKKWLIILARRINQPDGSFGGVAYGTIALDHFQKLFSEVDLGRLGSVALRGDELMMIERYPEPKAFEDYVGQKNASPEFRQLVQANPKSGTYQTSRGFDQMERTYSYCKITGRPLYVVVGLSPREYLAAWRNEAIWVSLLLAIFLITTVTSSWQVYRDWKRKASDIQILARQKAALAASEERYRRLEDESTDTIFIVSDGKIVFINPAGVRLLGAGQPDRVLGKSPIEFISPNSRGSAANQFVGHEPSPAHLEKYLRPDGTVMDVETTSIPTTFDQRPGIQVILHDVTERLRLEEQLRQAQKMEALGTLAGGTAHEFNNMLGIMLGNCEFAKLELAPDHPAQLQLAEILKAGQRAKEIVQQVLAFSRLQKGTRVFLELRTPVLEAVQQVRHIVPGTVAIQTDLPTGSPPILGNATQIHQVVMNICLNAWHAMEENHGLIQLTEKTVTLNDADAKIHPALHAGPYLQLTITDNGRGMERKILDRIFEPFFTTKAPGKGSGLGLAVVHGIMQSHEGAVVARSEPGQGSTFDLYFPAHPEARLKTAQAPATPAVVGNGLHILLVDDEPSLCRIAAKFLHRLGYSTTEADSATAALNKIREQPEHFNLVITDLTMPEMDGLSLARAIHQLRPGLPVILASGFDMQRTGEADDPPNIRARLQKPYTRDTLLEQVNSVLNGKDAG